MKNFLISLVTVFAGVLVFLLFFQYLQGEDNGGQPDTLQYQITDLRKRNEVLVGRIRQLEREVSRCEQQRRGSETGARSDTLTAGP
jgi:cell division protein FtsB